MTFHPENMLSKIKLKKNIISVKAVAEAQSLKASAHKTIAIHPFELTIEDMWMFV